MQESSSSSDLELRHVTLEEGEYVEGSYAETEEEGAEDGAAREEEGEGEERASPSLVDQACFLVHLGVRGLSCHSVDHRSARAVFVHRVHHALLWLRIPLCLLLLALGMFESPPSAFSPSACNCTRAPLPLSSVPLMPPSSSLPLEFCALLLLSLGGPLLQSLFLRPRAFLRPLNLVYCAALFLSLLDVCLSMASSSLPRSWRISPLLRPLLFCLMTPWGVAALASYARALYAVLIVLPFVLLSLVLFAFYGALAWRHDPSQPAFRSFSLALSSLQELLTTVNFPSIMFPGYATHRSSVFFYIAFVVVSLYFLLTFLLASVFSSYERSLAREARLFRSNRRDSLLRAFQLLRPVNFSTFRRLVRRLERRYYPGRIDTVHCDTLFASLHSSSQSYFGSAAELRASPLPMDRFLQLPSIVDTVVRKRRQRKKGCLYRRPWYKPWKRAVRSTAFEVVVGVAIVLNIAVVGVGVRVASITMERLDLYFFVWLFVFEMALKMTLLGFFRYWRGYAYEGVIAIVSALLGVLSVALDSQSQLQLRFSGVLQIVLVCRLLRFLRVLLLLRPFRVIFFSYLKSVALLGRFVVQLGTVYYVFGAVGQLAFGDLLWEGNEALQGTVYAQRGWYALNFNDMASSWVSLFVIMLVNDWTVVAEACEAVTTPYARFFFVLFWIFCTLVGVNLFVSYLLSRARENDSRLKVATSHIVVQRVRRSAADGKSLRVERTKHSLSSHPDIAEIELQ